jgi:hypothetical protein
MQCGFPRAVGITTVSLVINQCSAIARWTVMDGDTRIITKNKIYAHLVSIVAEN